MISNDLYYDKLANSYRVEYKNRLPYIKTVNEKICKFINPNRNLNILDIGVGDGERAMHFISQLNIKKNNYYGLEPSNKMFQKAKTKLLDKNLYNLNLENFNHKIKFDYIWFLWNVIGHVNDADTFFLKVTRLIKDNGYIIFDFNNLFNIEEYGYFKYLKNKILSLFISVFKFKLTNLNNTTQVNFYTKSYINKILKKNNIQIKKIYFINYQNGKIEKYMHRGQVLMICKYTLKN